MTDDATGDAADPRGLIAEAYRIEGITAAECRSIFLDWLLRDGTGRGGLERLLARHGRSAPDHPMTAILAEALAGSTPRPRRRGGARGRRAPPAVR